MVFKGKFAIGVIHLPRLPSIINRIEERESIIEQAVREALLLEKLGFHGVLVENYGDTPYPKRVHDPLTISFMSVVVREVARSTSIPVGVNLLRNSGREAYSIAVASGAMFIRVNALVEALVTDSGIVEPEAPRLKPLRLNYPGIEVFGDVFCKHGVSMNLALARSLLPLEEAVKTIVEDLVERGGADYVVVTGARTGEAPQLELLKLVKKYSSKPVVVGSGSGPENLKTLMSIVDGVIVGSFIKMNGRAGNPVDPERATTYINAFREAVEAP